MSHVGDPDGTAVSARIVPVEGAAGHAIDEAARLLAAGELVAFPTETVYGLGADASNPAALARLFEAKRRPADHPVIVHVSNLQSALQWSASMPDGARALAERFWPGPLTLVVPRGPRVPDAVTGGQASVGLRAPSHPVARALLAAFGGGIAAPSANRFGHVSPTTARHVADDLGDAIALILDGGPCDFGIESTIVAFDGDLPLLLRPGAIGVDAIAAVLGRAPVEGHAAAPRASGTLPSHYAPRTPAARVAHSALRAEVGQLGERDERVGVLAFDRDAPEDFDGVWIAASRDPARYAHELYANLRRLDGAAVDVILIEDVPAGVAWAAVRDRLARATAGVDDDRD